LWSFPSKFCIALSGRLKSDLCTLCQKSTFLNFLIYFMIVNKKVTHSLAFLSSFRLSSLRQKSGRGRLNRKKLTSTSTNLTSKTVTSNLTSKTGGKWGQTGSNGVIASPIIISGHPPPPTPQGTPFDPVLLSMLPFRS